MRWKSCLAPRGALLAVLAAVVTACTEPPTTVLEPNPERTLELGSDGPFGAELFVRDLRVRVDDVVRTDVLVATEGDGSIACDKPVVVFVHGGLVTHERYRWLAAHIASRGFVVVSPHHEFDLAFFEQSNAADVLLAVRAASARAGDALECAASPRRAAIYGHSLGGVVAATTWSYEPDLFSHLALLASYTAEGSFAERTPPGRVVSIVGTADAKVSLEQARAGTTALATSGLPVTLAAIEGMNHMQVVSELTPDEEASAGMATLSTDDARALVRVVLDAWLDDFDGRPSGFLDTPSEWPAGVFAADELGAP
jgi:pimeloyl-ACP methyl ester carboxylesterase